MTPLIGVDEAQARLLAGVEPLPGEDAPFAAALGRILATDVVARLTQPPFTTSAMDGYAIRWADLPGPWRIIGESAAGRRFAGTAGPGDAVRILTGAPLPAGTDTIVVQEDVARASDDCGDTLALTGDGPPHAGAHLRHAGLDFAAGTVVAHAGERVTPARIGVAAAAGHATLPVHRRPRVALLATGDELVPPGTTPGPDAIVSSNGVMLAALLGAYADVTDGGIVADTREALAAAIRAHAGADVLVTIGGASVGDHDHVMPVLTALGATIDFWKIALRPGKPMLSGTLGATRIVGLPGNPVSAFVCSTLFVVPLLRALGGDPAPFPVPVMLPAGEDLPANGPRRDYLRARAVHGSVIPSRRQDSAMLHVLATSSALIVREAHAPPLNAGEMVPCIVLDTTSGVA
jgi:molybdopterin molybdotransferase